MSAFTTDLPIYPFEGKLTKEQLDNVLKTPNITFVEADTELGLNRPPNWGEKRSDGSNFHYGIYCSMRNRIAFYGAQQYQQQQQPYYAPLSSGSLLHAPPQYANNTHVFYVDSPYSQQNIQSVPSFVPNLTNYGNQLNAPVQIPTPISTQIQIPISIPTPASTYTPPIVYAPRPTYAPTQMSGYADGCSVYFGEPVDDSPKIDDHFRNYYKAENYYGKRNAHC
jgi:hypothetical protein